jgi:serpin B
VEVNEEGTRAGALLASYMRLLAEGDEPPRVRADHPFFFLIRDNRSGSIHFLGRVLDPSK